VNIYGGSEFSRRRIAPANEKCKHCACGRAERRSGSDGRVTSSATTVGCGRQPTYATCVFVIDFIGDRMLSPPASPHAAPLSPPSSSPSPPPPPPTISSRTCPFPPPLWMRRVLRRLCSAHRSFRVSPATLPCLTSATPRAFPFYPPRPPALALSTFCRVTVVAPWRCRPCARTLRQMAFCLMMTVVTADTLTFFSLDRVHCSCWTLHVPCMVLLTCMSSLSSWWGR